MEHPNQADLSWVAVAHAPHCFPCKGSPKMLRAELGPNGWDIMGSSHLDAASMDIIAYY